MEFEDSEEEEEEWFWREEPDILKKSVTICCLSCCKFNYGVPLWNMRCEFCGAEADWRRLDDLDSGEYMLLEEQFKALKVYLEGDYS